MLQDVFICHDRGEGGLLEETSCGAQGGPSPQKVIEPSMSVLQRLRNSCLKISQEKRSCIFKALLICYNFFAHAKFSLPYLILNS